MIDRVPFKPDQSPRVSLGHDARVTVYGWPSKGDVYTLHDCLGVELEFLGYDRFNPPKSRAGSQAEEDVHCDRSQFSPITFNAPPLFFFLSFLAVNF